MSNIKINLPWVEINEYVVNINHIATVNPNTQSYFKSGILLKDGTWLTDFTKDELRELRSFLMNKKEHQSHVFIEVDGEMLDDLHDSQLLKEYLEEEYHCCDA